MARRGIPKKGASWYIREWMDALGVKQKDMIERCGWSKASAHQIYHGKQDYSPKVVHEAAQALSANLTDDMDNIEPWELLMPYERAMALRRIQADAKQIASHSVAPDRTGTDG